MGQDLVGRLFRTGQKRLRGHELRSLELGAGPGELCLVRGLRKVLHLVGNQGCKLHRASRLAAGEHPDHAAV